MTTGLAAVAVREAIRHELGKLGMGATGPTARLLASLTGNTEIAVLSALRGMEHDGEVTGRAVRENGDLHWVPPELDTIPAAGTVPAEAECRRCGRMITVSRVTGELRKHRRAVLDDNARRKGAQPAAWCLP